MLSSDVVFSSFAQFLETQSPERLVWAAGIIIVGFVLRRPLALLLLHLLGSITKSLGVTLSEYLRDLLRPAGQAIVVSVFALIAADQLTIADNIERVLAKGINSVLVTAVFSALYDLVQPFGLIIHPDNRLRRVNVGREWIEKMTKIAIVALCVASVLDVWGIEIGSSLTGLGVFGAAVALATQDFIRNLVAGMSNMSEGRFKVGDWIKMANGEEGIVELIELRSTLVRRFDRGAAYIPNGDLSNATVVNFNSRRHRQISWSVPLQPQTASAQLQKIRDSIASFVRNSPDFLNTDDFPVRVRVETVSSDATAILIYIYTETAEYTEFLAVKERLVLAVVEAVHQADAKFAYRGIGIIDDADALPSQT